MQFDFFQYYGFLVANIFLIIILMIVVFIVVNALFLGIALGFVNGENRDFGTTFGTALGSALLGWIPCLGCIIAWWLIKTRHELGWGGAIIAWILTGIIAAIVIVALFFTVLAGFFVALPF
ncbi:MAG: hypothetical protein ACXADL_04405 [Candidatus Thorarchaeota archaeon]|jgi:hypothetical protein